MEADGRTGPATAEEISVHLQRGRFFWLDVESPGDDELASLCRTLCLSAEIAGAVARPTQRSSFAMDPEAVRVVLPAAVQKGPTSAWLEAEYVSLVSTQQFLFTAHAAPCLPLHEARDRYRAVDEDARSSAMMVLFLVLDVLISSFRSQLLALDDRMGEVQLSMLGGASSAMHDELIQILGILTDGIQELGWYSLELEEVAEKIDRLPGISSSLRQRFDRHVRLISHLKQNGAEVRAEARDALGHYSEIVAGRQARVISSLTIVATIFLPLSFLTGYFGMNFRVLTSHAENTLWQYLVFGVLLLVASAALSLLLIHRLERRFGTRASR
jgi:Mg2+ and Co2+ transporter CorA